jgi:hypothetical protein
MRTPLGGGKSLAPVGGDEGRSPWRTFANHDLAVYLANGQTLKPDLDESPANCRHITELFTAVRKGVVDLEQRPATLGGNERADDHVHARAGGSHLADASLSDRKSISTPRIGPRERIVRRSRPAGIEL